MRDPQHEASTVSIEPRSPGTASVNWSKLINGLLRLAAVLVALGLVGNLLFVLLGSTPVLPTLARVNPFLIVLALVVVSTTFVTGAIRIRLWSRLFGLPTSRSQATAAITLNEVGSAITPSAAGGGYFKVIYLSSLGMQPARATLMMFIGSLEDFVFVLCCIPVTIYLTHSWDNPHVVAAGKNFLEVVPVFLLIIGVGLLTGFFFRRQLAHLVSMLLPKSSPGEPHQSLGTRIRRGIRHFIDEFKESVVFVFQHGRSTFTIGSALAIIGWCARYVSINLILAAFGISVPLVLAALLNWTVFTITNFIPTPGGTGGAELAFATVFESLVPPDMMPTLVLTWRMLTFYLPLSLSALYLVWMTSRPAGHDKLSYQPEQNTGTDHASPLTESPVSER